MMPINVEFVLPIKVLGPLDTLPGLKVLYKPFEGDFPTPCDRAEQQQLLKSIRTHGGLVN